MSKIVLPSNVQKWVDYSATEEMKKSITKVKRWLGSVDRNVVGGTTIGKAPQTLILDLTHHGSQIYIYADGKMSFMNKVVERQVDFKAVYAENFSLSPIK